jgi:hypothetical protein
MKKHFLLPCILCSLLGSAQTTLNKANTSFVELYDANGRPLTSKSRKEIKGSPMLNDNWGKGTIKFRNKKVFENALLRFNLFSNKLFYKVDDMELAIIDPISEFSFSYEENNEQHSVVFRNGYPGNTTDPGEVFYQVLSEGPRFQLLKHSYKTVQDYYEYGSAPTKIFRYASELFIYDAKMQTLKLVKNKQPLTESVPVLTAELAGTDNPFGKFRSEKDLINLMNKLNNP